MAAGNEAQENQTRTIERLLAAAQVGGQVVVSGILGVVLYQIFGGDMAALALLSPAFARLVETVGGDLLAGWFERVASDTTLTAADIQKLFEKELKKHDLEATLKHDLEATLRQINLKYDLLSELPSRAMLQQIALALDERAAGRAGELERLLRQALERLAEQAAPTVGSLPVAPAPPEHFVGREKEMERLAAALTRAEQPQAITALQGSGGIGKTALAQALAARLAGHFGGGVFWADLAGVNGDPLPLLAAWAGLCGQNAAGLAADGPGRAAQARGLLAARQAAQGRLLLALDDVRPEWVAGARLLQQARPAGAALLLTTREETTALRLGATINSLDVLADEAAAKLLLELVPDKLTPAAAAEIAGLCGNWPLALRLAGALAAAEGAAWLLPRLRDGRRLRTLAHAGAASKEESVALAFDLSYTWLAETDAAAVRAFRWLAAFAAAPVNAARLAAVLAWGELPESEQARRLAELEEWGELDEGWAATAEQVEAAEETLRRLRRAALLQTATAPATVAASATAVDTDWYALHPLLRDYAAAKLDAAGERAAAENAHCGTHLAYAIAHEAADPAAYDALEQARADVLLALDRAYAAQAWAPVRQFVWALDNYLDVRGYWREQHKRLEQAIEAAQAEENKRELAAFVHNLAIVAQDIGEMETARQRYEESLAIQRELGNRAGIATTLHQLGRLAQDTGEMETARQRYAESLAIARELGNRSYIAGTTSQLGILAESQGDYTESKRLHEESLKIRREIGDRQGIAIDLHQLGNIAYLTGEMETARQRYAESLAIERELGNRAGIASTLHQLGMLAHATGEMETARQRYAESLAIERELGNRAGIAISLHQLGRLAQATGEMETARQRYAESLAIQRELGNRAGIASTLGQLGNLAQDTGEMDTARQRYEEVLEMMRELGNRAGIATTLGQLANMEDDEGNEAEAERLYREVMQIVAEIGDVATVSIAQFNLALLLEKQARLDEALPLLRQAVEIAEHLRMPVAAGRRTALERVQQKLAAQRSNTA